LTINGARKRIPTGTENRRLAEMIHAKALTDIQEGRWFERQQGKVITFRELAEKYMAKYKRQRDPVSVKHLLCHFAEMRLAEITSEAVEDYIISRDESEKRPKPATVYQEFSLGRRIFNVARRRWKWVSYNPFADVQFSELLTMDNARDRWLTVSEEKVLLSCATPAYLKDVITFAIHSGCRRGEILSLKWKVNVDMHRRLVTVQASKNGNKKTIPMSETLRGLLLGMSKVKHISGRVFPVDVLALKDAFERAVRKAGIEDFRFHDLRHTFATRLVQNGVDLYTVQKLMGHKSIRTTERYAHHYPESLRPSVRALDECYREEFGHVLVTVGAPEATDGVARRLESPVESITNRRGSG